MLFWETFVGQGPLKTAEQRTALAGDLRRLNELLDAGLISEARAYANQICPRALIALSGTPAHQLYWKLKQIAGPSYA